MEKGLCIAVVAVFAGFVGYKIVQKKNPALIKNAQEAVADAGKKMKAVLDAAKESFYEGYAQG
ncbi:MAG TPA: hypothetical protein DD723_01450 [Candidatus Omnitrophica bacterium]|nr:MAG: hypothetical protein A2Z81_01970 [Omnitrophica WOR_2 bacterium GWA2_45_18]OGX21234.1 MAG: hypothetical protein A2Y04_00455 [Omnitrophica WOR_2 bacterium GWC2_45_7]HBR14197.1 hypothetical protein [Candidatus Omnitrophota bacterium]